MSHRLNLQPGQNTARPDVLEGSQERTLAVLLEQAFRIKEEVAAGLQSTQGSVQVEAMSRKLLENHILTITRIVKQLSMDIKVLERQIAQRDSITSGTTMAVHSLDQKNMAGIGDLRGRVTRCDAGIAKLSADTSSGELRIIRLQQEVADLRSAVDVRLKELEVKLYRDVWKSLTQHLQGQKSSEADLHAQVQLLEVRLSGEVKEAKQQTDWLTERTERQLNRFSQTHAASSTQLHDKMSEMESRLAVRLRALEARVDQRDQTHQLKHSEIKLSERMASLESSLHQQLQLLKQEYYKGFLSVHDAIESLRQIGDIKSRLDMQKLEKDIRHLCSRVAELSD